MNPYRLIFGLFLALSSSLVSGQSINSSPAPEGYELELEVVAEDIGLLAGALGVTDLTGYSCTHLFVVMNNADDFMSSVSGDLTNPTYINTTTDLSRTPRCGYTERHQQLVVSGLPRFGLRQLGDHRTGGCSQCHGG